MEYNHHPIILVTNLYRSAKVSQARGERVLDQLESAGEIFVLKTVTGRKLVTPAQGEILLRALCGKGAL